MSNHRWNLEAIFYEYGGDGYIIQVKRIDCGKSKKEVLKKLNKIDSRRIKSLTWRYSIYKVY